MFFLSACVLRIFGYFLQIAHCIYKNNKGKRTLLNILQIHVMIFKMQMSEETFESLLDVMEKHFAALKLLDDESEHKLTRTTSFSDLPSTRSRILIEQCFQHPNSPGLMRQYSCEQIVNRADNVRQVKISEKLCKDNKQHTRTWKTTVPCITNTWNTDWNSYKGVTDTPIINKSDQNQIEYMEIDKSYTSDHNEENTDTVDLTNFTEVIPPESKNIPIQQSNMDSVKETYEETKKKYRPLTSSIMKIDNRSSTYFSFKLMFFMLIPILVFLIAAFLNREEFIEYTCDHEPYFSNASLELQHKIYGQDKVILSLIKFLETYEGCTRMAVLVGGTGVGKSYTIDIIRRNFPTDGTILHYTPPLNKVDINEILPYRCNLVVFENLRENAITEVIDLSINILNLKKTCVTILAVINVEKVSNKLSRTIQLDAKIAEIKAVLSKENIYASLFGYAHLEGKTMEKCIKQAMKDSNLTLSKDQIQEVKESLLTSNSGCKGAYAKVQIVGRE